MLYVGLQRCDLLVEIRYVLFDNIRQFLNGTVAVNV